MGYVNSLDLITTRTPSSVLHHRPPWGWNPFGPGETAASWIEMGSVAAAGGNGGGTGGVACQEWGEVPNGCPRNLRNQWLGWSKWDISPTYENPGPKHNSLLGGSWKAYDQCDISPILINGIYQRVITHWSDHLWSELPTRHPSGWRMLMGVGLRSYPWLSVKGIHGDDCICTYAWMVDFVWYM